ncbi:MAG TPA: DUF4388 domain-containing protein [Vicinamibacteria bacterium]|nr:DUF4388 domain-containing protein [Vicinamibacteria bacterium]
MAVESEVAEAVHELHEYLSDRLPPLMVADSMGVLLQHPLPVLSSEIGVWVGQQQGVATVSDLLYHCVRKVSLMGEFELIPRDALAQSLRQLSQEVLQFCPEAEREQLRESLKLVGQGSQPTLAAPVTVLHRQQPAAEPPPVAEGGGRLAQAVTAGVRRLTLFLDRLRPQAAATPVIFERRQQVAAQFVTTAAAESKTQVELEQRLAPLRELGLASEPDQVFRTLAHALAGWGALPVAGGGPAPAVANELGAMRQIVALADDPAEGARRFRELVHAAVEQFNEGNLGRSAVIFDLAEQLAAEQKVKPAFVEPLRTGGHEYLDKERLRKYAERQDCRRGLQRVLCFYSALQPGGLLDALDGEPSRDRRHQLIGLLEVHGAPARALARERLQAYVEGRAEMDAFFPMNLVYLLRAIPRPEEVPLEEEVQLVTRAPGRSSPLPLVKQVIAYLSYTHHEKAERALITFLRVFETMLLQPDKASYPQNEVEALLDRTCVALARYGTPRAWQALVDHGLNAEARLGSTLARLAEAGKSQNLAASPEVVGRLLAALNAELPKKTVLGLAVRRPNEERIALLIQALSGTPIPAVMEALQEIVDKHAGQKFAEEAFRALSTLKAASRPADTGASLAGDLELFGLPDVLQTLGGTQATGLLTLMDDHGRQAATILLENGQFRGATCQAVSGADAMYQLFEKPFKGTFAFVARRDHLGGDGVVPATELMGLIFEGVRRHDELKRAAALVPDGAVLRATGQPWSGLQDEDQGFAGQVWASAAAGGTAEGCEAQWATDSYRVRRLLAHWTEEGALTVLG